MTNRDEINSIEQVDNNLDQEEKKTEEAIEGVLERVAKNDPEAAVKISEYIVQKIHHGPMPSPEDIRGYSLTQADLPERMMVMAEIAQLNKAKHADSILELKAKEIELNDKHLTNQDLANKRESNNQTLSLILASGVVVICILGSFYLALQDKTEVALVIGGTTVLGVVGSFLKSNNKTTKKEVE
ncbi:hypothetical protein [Aliivibrio fischeri]|uniref:hypothetical protein n=1 Tax=Aliivibrio fischeri TaxID=668 RepID=UPI00084C40DD|nr:hypothetical protein [Aliivibrio fischeri]OED52785.1 hypothetical protein BEI46_18305 [Aliivibrio fischeri]